MEGVGLPYFAPSAAYAAAKAATRVSDSREPTCVLEVESGTAEESLPYVELFVRHDYWETLRKFVTVDMPYQVRYLSNESRDVDWVKYGPHCAMSDMYDAGGDWLFFSSKYGMCGMQMVYEGESDSEREEGEEEEGGGEGGEFKRKDMVEMPRLSFFINMGYHDGRLARNDLSVDRPLAMFVDMFHAESALARTGHGADCFIYVEKPFHATVDRVGRAKLLLYYGRPVLIVCYSRHVDVHEVQHGGRALGTWNDVCQTGMPRSSTVASVTSQHRQRFLGAGGRAPGGRTSVSNGEKRLMLSLKTLSLQNTAMLGNQVNFRRSMGVNYTAPMVSPEVVIHEPSRAGGARLARIRRERNSTASRALAALVDVAEKAREENESVLATTGGYVCGAIDSNAARLYRQSLGTDKKWTLFHPFPPGSEWAQKLFKDVQSVSPRSSENIKVVDVGGTLNVHTYLNFIDTFCPRCRDIMTRTPSSLCSTAR